MNTHHVHTSGKLACPRSRCTFLTHMNLRVGGWMDPPSSPRQKRHVYDTQGESAVKEWDERAMHEPDGDEHGR